MELVKGLSITEFCDQNQYTPRQRLELFVSVCQAVQHAHQKGIIHRDLKPSNVLVTMQDGTPLVKVIDFGIAKALGQQLTDKTMFTGFAQMVGTPAYMSPEQVALSNVDVDTRSDVYSLGVLLYELLTGTTPLTKKQLRKISYDELRRIIREEEPPKPSTRISTLRKTGTTIASQRSSDPKRLSQLFRGELDWIVMKALDKDRNRRYESASAFAADVQRHLNNEAVEACPPSAWYRIRKFAGRNKGPVLTAALVLLALVAGIIGTSIGLVRAEEANTAESYHRGVAEKAQRQEANQRGKAEEARDLAEDRLYCSDMVLAQHAWEQGSVQLVQERLVTHLPQKGKRDLRGWEWYYLQSQSHQSKYTLQGLDGVPCALAFSPDGRKLALASHDGDSRANLVTVREMGTGRELFRRFTPPKASNWAAELFSELAWSPDGKFLTGFGYSVNGEGTVHVWEIDSGREVFMRDSALETPMSSAWSPDGKFLAIAFCGRKGQDDWAIDDWALEIWEPAAKKKPRILPFPKLELPRMMRWKPNLSWSPDSKRLAFTAPVKWNPDNKPLAFAAPEKINFFLSKGGNVRHYFQDQIIVWNVVTGQKEASLDTEGSLVRNGRRPLAWSPDGQHIAWASEFSLDSEVRVRQVQTGKVKGRLILEKKSMFDSLTWGPEGGNLIVVCLREESSGESVTVWGAGGTLTTVWEPATNKEIALKHPSSDVWAGTFVALKPDGRSIAAGAEYGMVKIWDVATGREKLRLREHASDVLAVAWTPDGKQLASADSLGTVRIWELLPGRHEDGVTLGGYKGAKGKTKVAWAPDSRLLATSFVPDGIPGAPRASKVRIWDVDSGVQIQSLGGSEFEPTGLAWSPNGQILAVGGSLKVPGRSSLERVLKFWDTATWAETQIRVDKEFSPFLAEFVFSPDSKQLAKQGRCAGDFVAWELASGKEILRLKSRSQSDRLRSAPNWILCPSWERLAFYRGKHQDGIDDIVVSDLATGKEVVTLKMGESVPGRFAWNPKGTKLASPIRLKRKGETIKIWEMPSGKELLTLRGHLDAVGPLAWNPDGKRLASGGRDGTVRMWDTTVGMELLTLRGLPGAVHSLAWSPDGKRLAAGGNNGAVKVWDASSGYSKKN